jgi:hypothetical protein
MYLYGIHSVLLGPQYVLKYDFIWSIICNPYLAKPIKREKIGIESYGTTVIRSTWYVFKSRLPIRAHISL